MSSRQQANIEILNKLSQYVTDNPDIRLGQALVNLSVIKITYNLDVGNEVENPFYEEPETMLARVVSTEEKYKKQNGG